MKWNMDVIKSKEGYRGIISFEYEPDIYIDTFPTWKEFAEDVRRKAGLSIPRRKSFKFQKLSDFETIAGIDACHVRPSCIVTMEDRKKGWERFAF